MTSCSQESSNRHSAIRACEKFIKGTLKRPETYRRLAADYRQEAISIPRYKQLLGNEKFTASDDFWIGLWAQAGSKVAYSTIDSVAENDLGLEIGGRNVCVFQLFDNKLNDADSDAASALAKRSNDMLLGQPSNRAVPEHACCILPRTH